MRIKIGIIEIEPDEKAIIEEIDTNRERIYSEEMKNIVDEVVAILEFSKLKVTKSLAVETTEKYFERYVYNLKKEVQKFNLDLTGDVKRKTFSEMLKIMGEKKKNE